MSRYLAFEPIPKSRIPQWTLTEEKPKSCHLLLPIDAIWSNVAKISNDVVKLEVQDNIVTKITLVEYDTDLDDDALYVSLHDIFVHATDELPTQPIEYD